MQRDPSPLLSEGAQERRGSFSTPSDFQTAVTITGHSGSYPMKPLLNVVRLLKDLEPLHWEDVASLILGRR